MKLQDLDIILTKEDAASGVVRTIDEYGNIEFKLNGLLHRDGDKPAGIYVDGDRYWCQHGEYHRDGDRSPFGRAQRLVGSGRFSIHFSIKLVVPI